ncbi:type VI secretion system tip protein VgrG (plasmid) [Acetobacteraceae bacterium]|nr:type VI secretion system tip protein VgrG [Acetobacteraceae bacterium]
MEVVPELYFLKDQQINRTFQQKTAKAILEEILTNANIEPNFSHIEDTTTLPYVTQFNETHLDFLHRFMRENGYFYYFKHTQEDAQMVIGRDNKAFEKKAPNLYQLGQGGDHQHLLREFHSTVKTLPKKITVLTSNLDKEEDTADASFSGTKQSETLLTGERSLWKEQRETKNWVEQKAASSSPSSSTTTQEGLADYTQQAILASASLCSGLSTDPTFQPGLKIHIAASKTDKEGYPYVLQQVIHQAEDLSWYRSNGEKPKAPSYDNQFKAFPSEINWHDEVPQRPLIGGIYSGLIQGNQNKGTIETDKLGRIKVKLRFDQDKTTKAGNIIWARLLNPWSGENYGWMHLPRVGTEVAVSFMGGDIDQPVIVGCFYNNQDLPPYKLPDKSSVSGIKTRTLGSEQAGDGNELCFDDNKDNETSLTLKSQRSMRLEALQNQNINVHKNQSVEISGKQELTVKEKQTVKVEKGRETVIGEGDTLTIKGGPLAIKTSNGKIVIEANSGIEFRCGPATIEFSPAGISIKGGTISFD